MNSLKMLMARLSLKAKVLLLSASLVWISVVNGTIGFISNKMSASDFDQLVNFTLASDQATLEMKVAAQDYARQLASLGLPGNSKTEFDLIKQQLTASRTQLESASKKREGFPFDNDEHPLFEKTAQTWKILAQTEKSILDKLSAGSAEETTQALKLIRGSASETYTHFIKALNDLEFSQGSHRNQEIDTSKSRGGFFNWVTLLLTIMGTFYGMGLGYLITRLLTQHLGEVADSLSEGAAAIGSIAHEASGVSAQLSESSQKQASALQQTVSSLEEISSTVARNAENAERSQVSSVESRDTANTGKTAVTEMVRAIGEINASNVEIMNAIEASNTEMSEITQVISDIGEKTKIINDIVFQTKLLSFNASVEAARAGEHGKGFAVVAEEVGNLAAMSGNAAKEITTMLNASIDKVNSIVESTKTKVERLIREGKQKVEAGTQIAEQCGKVLEEVVVSVNKVTEMVAEIATASKEQAQGVQQISIAMNQLDQAAQSGASVAVTSAKNAEALDSQSQTLKDAVESLVSAVNGSRAEINS